MRTREENLRRLRESDVIKPGQKWVVDDFRPEDASGIARLFYAVYGENFPYDGVYDPEEIIRANAEKRSHHVVGRTESGDIVGVYAFFRNPPGKRIIEGGSWIVSPSYRNGTMAFRLAHKAHVSLPAKLGVNILFGQIVCDHLITQKLGEKIGSVPCAIEIEAMPPRPDAGDPGGRSRISLLDGFIPLGDDPHAVFLPPRYAAMLRDRYSALKMSREFPDDPGTELDCLCTTETMDTASLVKITVDRPGRDLAKRLRTLERANPARRVHQLYLPLWLPGASAAAEAARGLGYFLGGLLPLWADRDVLLLQKLSAVPDFQSIRLTGNDAPALLEAVVEDCRSLETER